MILNFSSIISLSFLCIVLLNDIPAMMIMEVILAVPIYLEKQLTKLLIQLQQLRENEDS